MKLSSGIWRAAAVAIATVRACAAEGEDDPALNLPHYSFLRASAARGDADGAAAVVESWSAPDDARHRGGGRVLQGTTTCAGTSCSVAPAMSPCCDGTSTCTGAGPVCTMSTTKSVNIRNNKWGVMFDVKALTDLQITSIIYYPSTSSNQNVNVYTAPGEYSPIARDRSSWQKIADEQEVTVQSNQPATVTLPTAVGISSGSTQAFYLWSTSRSPVTNAGIWSRKDDADPAANIWLHNDHVQILGPVRVHEPQHSEFGSSDGSTQRQIYGGIGYDLSPFTSAPSKSPTASPSTASPSQAPTGSPTTASPSQAPTGSPTTASPSKSPSSSPSKTPTASPSQVPTGSPTTASPSKLPSSSPTGSPTTASPSASPTTGSPSKSPSSSPTGSPTTASPSASPTTGSPSTSPTTASPTTALPTSSPTTPQPTKKPTPKPTSNPTSSPTPGSFWYPDWELRTDTCKNDGREPNYMKRFETYYESSLRACCEKYFSWDIIMCTGGEEGPVPPGYYPNWLNGESKCFGEDDREDIPDYMRNNPGDWFEGEAEACCERYFSWDYNRCVSLTSGSSTTPAGGTSEWWVDWQIRKCVKNCNDPTDDDCGGLAKPWDELFGGASECCASRLSYVERSECTVA